MRRRWKYNCVGFRGFATFKSNSGHAPVRRKSRQQPVRCGVSRKHGHPPGTHLGHTLDVTGL
eukprot:1193696-Pyramimonas_sp.AAC.1